MMNKYKKIAMAAVATVMAGSMVFSLAACTPGGGNNGGGNGGGDTSGGITDVTKLPDKYDVVDDNGNIKYSSYERSTPVTLNIAIGHQDLYTSTSYKTALGAEITLPDGKKYSNNNMKPAWVKMGSELNITWNDTYGGSKDYATNSNLTQIIADGDYAKTDMFTTDLSVAVAKAAEPDGPSILNLADYLDYMPHFRAFLESNPIVYLSLLQAGMNTTTGANKILYVAPYFDGNDAIERYCIIRQDWADKLLNGNTTLENSIVFSGSTYVESYMQQTGKLPIESLNAAGNGKIKIVKNYDAVVSALKTADSALDRAYKAIAGTAYDGTSGNIVDIQNAAIKAGAANATGDKLVNLVRAYIDVCYENEDGTKHYTADTRSNLFNGYDACWDVDDLVAVLRCVKTNGTALAGSKTVYGIAPRDGTNDRTPDMVRLAAQLYGVRGADSRYENTYIDSNGVLQDARNDLEFYEAMTKMNLLKQEGLIRDYSGITNAGLGQGYTKTAEAFMMYDYNQTQTKYDFYVENEGLGGTELTFSEDYYFAPIITPVSKWDVDGDGNHTDIMRFTESWRSTKTGGLALNGALANNADKLKAALQFVDFLYSEDGQIVSTFGPMAENAEGTNGFWYNTAATDAQIQAGEYFTYKGVKYSGTSFEGKTTPTITSNLYNSFLGKTVHSWKIGDLSDENMTKCALSFTDYARKLIGSTLPVGVKNQSFENQLTSLRGRTGAGKVGVALDYGVVKGMTLKMDSNNWWYTCVPSGLPIASDRVNRLNESSQDFIQFVTGKKKKDKNFYSIFNYLILSGATGTYNQQEQTYTFETTDALKKMVETFSKSTNEGGKGAQLRETISASGWDTAKNYWTYLSAPTNTED